MLTRWQNPRTALSWLRMFRLGLVVLTGVSVALLWAAGVGPDLGPVASLYAGVALAELLERRWVARHDHHQWIVDAHAMFDLCFWVLAMLLKRAGDHPSLDTLVLFVIPAAFAMPASRAWFYTAAIILVHNLMVLLGPRLFPLPDVPPVQVVARTVDQLLVFDTSVVALAGFVISVRAVLAQREAMLQAALDDRSRDDRLVAIGMMAAGIAHELGTPLSSIDLLAGEAQAEPEEAPALLTTIRGQVRRCREILDRIRGTTHRTVSPEVEGLGLQLRNWVQDWQQAGSNRRDLQVELGPGTGDAGIRGDPESWRGIVWSLLDNALRAGAPITVRARVDGADVLVEIDDNGAGPTSESLARAGEPFYTHWDDGGATGRGLGLFVAASFARRWGGDVKLSRRAFGGGRVTVTLVRLTARAP